MPATTYVYRNCRVFNCDCPQYFADSTTPSLCAYCEHPEKTHAWRKDSEEDRSSDKGVEKSRTPSQAAPARVDDKARNARESTIGRGLQASGPARAVSEARTERRRASSKLQSAPKESTFRKGVSEDVHKYHNRHRSSSTAAISTTTRPIMGTVSAARGISTSTKPSTTVTASTTASQTSSEFIQVFISLFAWFRHGKPTQMDSEQGFRFRKLEKIEDLPSWLDGLVLKHKSWEYKPSDQIFDDSERRDIEISSFFKQKNLPGLSFIDVKTPCRFYDLYSQLYDMALQTTTLTKPTENQFRIAILIPMKIEEKTEGPERYRERGTLQSQSPGRSLTVPSTPTRRPKSSTPFDTSLRHSLMASPSQLRRGSRLSMAPLQEEDEGNENENENEEEDEEEEKETEVEIGTTSGLKRKRSLSENPEETNSTIQDALEEADRNWPDTTDTKSAFTAVRSSFTTTFSVF
ncbi:hypothetical protein BJ508DRAFT_327911 [Ascobolus immersus RN42]|uniref:Uncharacterized protein n=1 Tax=Ascobolus immersus RN42 TaxID=1160509 RepID=A0A3N4I6S0_ASCIM|nr:hypothetical protein BJ508DRAFT_327911 [Ascobolus immersus RN42]